MFKYNLPVYYSKMDWRDRRAVREQYVKEQNGVCLHCGCALDKSPPDSITKKRINWKLFPPNFLKHPVHLHHDHFTDLTKGAIHAYCNAVLWQYHGE